MWHVEFYVLHIPACETTIKWQTHQDAGRLISAPQLSRRNSALDGIAILSLTNRRLLAEPYGVHITASRRNANVHENVKACMKELKREIFHLLAKNKTRISSFFHYVKWHEIGFFHVDRMSMFACHLNNVQKNISETTDIVGDLVLLVLRVFPRSHCVHICDLIIFLVHMPNFLQ